MSFPNIPSVTPTISIRRNEVVNLLLASIGFEELGLAHLINAEAEKLQAVLGTLHGTTLQASSIAQLIIVNENVNKTLSNSLKKEMLLQFKLEDILNLSTSTSTSSSTTTTSSSTTTSSTTATTTSSTTTSSSTTSSSTSTSTTMSISTSTSSSTSSTSSSTTTLTTTSITITTGTVSTACNPALTFAVFAGRNFNIETGSVEYNDVQVNGNLNVSGDNNAFLGNTNVAGTFTDSGSDNLFEDLDVGSPLLPIKLFDANCLQSTADEIINNDMTINSQADAAPFQGKRIWVNGSVSITGNNIGMTGGGILASGGITVTGDNFTYTSTGCFAFYSQTGDILISNGPYNITGLIYTAQGDIGITTGQGGRVCGGLMSTRDIAFAGGHSVQAIIDVGNCSPCLKCNNFCST